MKRTLTDHGHILHWAGAHHMFPVQGPGDALGFATHGETEGRTAIGWQVFFPALERSRSLVVVDDEAGTIEVVPEAEAPAPHKG